MTGPPTVNIIAGRKAGPDREHRQRPPELGIEVDQAVHHFVDG